MPGIIGNYFIANFFDDSGEFIQSKSIKFTLTRPKVKTFTFEGGEYIVPDTSYMFKVKPFPYLFEYFVCSYQFGNPNPIKQLHTFQPIIKARALHSLLKNQLLEKLMAVRSGWGAIFTLKNILIAGGILLLLVFMLTGGDFTQLFQTTQVQGG